MKICIIGSNSLTGKAFINKYNNLHEIVAFQRNKTIEKKGVNYIYVDFIYHHLILEKIPSDSDAIIYLAQSNEFRNFPQKAEDILSINIELPSKIANLVFKNNIKSFIYFSTGGVYKNQKDAIAEECPILINDITNFYISSKLSCELLLSQYKGFIKNLTIFRPFFIYGKLQNETMLIPRLIQNIKNDNAVQYNGLHINPIHVEDVIDSIHQALNLENYNIINLAGNNIVSIKDIAENIAKILSKNLDLQISENTSLNLIGNINKLSSQLRKPKKDFYQELHRLVKES